MKSRCRDASVPSCAAGFSSSPPLAEIKFLLECLNFASSLKVNSTLNYI